MKEQETEIKLLVRDPARLKSRLRSLGATLARRRHFEDNFVFDLPDRRLRRRGSLLRVRLTDGKATLTFKGPSRIVARTKSRMELETDVVDGGKTRRILELLGLRCQFRYQKFRTVYQKGNALITVDETPMGIYFEIEGSPRSIRTIARHLGFQEGDFITATYVDLFRKYRRANRIQNRNMMFGIRA